MSGSLSDLLVISDVDDTLLDQDGRMISCNIAMIRLFCTLGGRFTIASGRTAGSARKVLAGIVPNCPAILCNGALLYDFAAGVPISEHFLDRGETIAAANGLCGQYPGVGAVIQTSFDRMYVPFGSRGTHRLAEREHIPYTVCPIAEIPGGWYKAVFAAEPETMKKMSRQVLGRKDSRLTFVLSSEWYMETIPKGINKGTALQELCSLTGTKQENVYAVGDYFNDLEFLRESGHPVAVGNAAEQVRSECERIVMPAWDGGVAQLLYDLIKKYG